MHSVLTTAYRYDDLVNKSLFCLKWNTDNGDGIEQFITGRYLHAVGNVMASMDDQQRSLEYHRRALFHYKSTLGNNHHRTADLFVKFAEHMMRMKQGENALYVCRT